MCIRDRSTPHPHPFQRMWVRSSTASYGSFNLDMGRSPGFGSADTDYMRPLQTWFPFGSTPIVLNLASRRNSPDRSTKSTRLYPFDTSTACKHRVSGSLSLPSRGAFHLSLTVLFAIAHQVVFSLGGWSPRLPAGFLVSCGTLDPVHTIHDFAYRAFTSFGWLSQNHSAIMSCLPDCP